MRNIIYLSMLCLLFITTANANTIENKNDPNSKERRKEKSSFILKPSINIQKNWGYFAGGDILIVASSHNDIAWFDTPAKTAEFRDKDCLTPALERMKNRDDVYFSMEDVLYLHEYLENRPDKKDEVYKLSASGYMDWGATYNQPYESLLSGEQLVRQVYLGAKEVRKMIPGISARVAYNPDVPGRSAQMPQILSKANVPYLVLSRHERGLFNWASPDGSKILCWSMEHYYDTHQLKYAKSTDEFISIINEKANEWEPQYKEFKLPPVNGVLFSEDYTGPINFDTFLDTLKIAREKQIASGDFKGSEKLLPNFRYSSAEQFFDKIAHSGAQLKTITGERPNIWLYIHGPAHHRAISSKRAAGVSLPAAETFSTVSSILKGSFRGYPQQELNDAWAASIYDDHGWGGVNGQITDLVFKRKLDFAKKQGNKLLNNALVEISDKVNTNDQQGQAIVLYNALSWKRTDPVQIKINSDTNNFSIVDYKGEEVAYQIISSNYNNEYLVSFIAKDIPSLGYKTYYVLNTKKSKQAANKFTADNSNYENEFYRLSFGGGGLIKLYDKQLNQELIKSDKFQAGEIFTMQSIGNGAGEFADIQSLTLEGFDKVSLHNQGCKLLSNGPVYAQYEIEQQMQNCLVKQQITVYHHIKRIDFNVDLLNWDGTEYREFRLAMPLNIANAEVTYEVPMGTVTIGKGEIDVAGWKHTTECKNVHPREVQNFISTNNGQVGITMSSCVAVFDYIDPAENAVDYPIIQPVLIASRRSCHGQGNWYLQEGDHHYSFSLFSHETGWNNGYRNAIQANNPIIPILSKSKKGTLPGEKSFFNVPENNVIISAIKKCEDDNNVIIRAYDIEGKDRKTNLNTFFSFEKAEHTNIIEEEGKIIIGSGKSLETKIGAYAIETYKLLPGK
ncbi:glycosyl hydrolase-related protein [Draconibacterium sp.]|nr:glycosyl hydrolase-related protein [Draconibacterium sp.]